MDRLWKIPLSVMALPIGEHQGWVTTTLNGMDLRALYLADGLEQRWVIDPAKNEHNYQIVLRMGLYASYYDFSNVAEGEETKAEAVFECRIVTS